MILPSSKHRSAAGVLLLLLGLAVLLTGCSSVDPAPFTQFAASLQPLRTATDAQAGMAVNASRQQILAEVAEDPTRVADLRLRFDPSDPFSTSYGGADDEPNFAKFKRFRRGLAALNDAMIAYARSLVVLAGGGEGGDILPTTAQFDQMARDLNANASSAAEALGLTLDPGRQALLSTVAIQLFKAYIESKRRKALSGAISEVQPRIRNIRNKVSVANNAIKIIGQIDDALSFLKTVTP